MGHGRYVAAEVMLSFQRRQDQFRGSRCGFEFPADPAFVEETKVLRSGGEEGRLTWTCVLGVLGDFASGYAMPTKEHVDQ